MDVPLTSANCLQSYLSGFSCWSRGDTVARVLPTSCQWKRGCRFPYLSSCGQSTAFFQLSGGLLALNGITVIACTYPSICCQELTELQSVPGTAFKVLPKWTEWGVSLDLQPALSFEIYHFPLSQRGKDSTSHLMQNSEITIFILRKKAEMSVIIGLPLFRMLTKHDGRSETATFLLKNALP